MNTKPGNIVEHKAQIGMRIRTLRKIQRRTLQDIADSCGFSRSLLSKIENGKIIPPVATLVRISEALGTHISNLLDDKQNGDDANFIKSEDILSNLLLTEKGYRISPLLGNMRDKKVQPFLFYINKHEFKDHQVSHPGDELVYILSGSIKFKVGVVEYSMTVGDSLYFNSRIPHHVIPDSEEAYYLDIFIE